MTMRPSSTTSSSNSVSNSHTFTYVAAEDEEVLEVFVPDEPELKELTEDDDLPLDEPVGDEATGA